MEVIKAIFNDRQALEEVLFVLLTFVWILFGLLTFLFFKHIRKHSIQVGEIMIFFKGKNNSVEILDGQYTFNIEYIDEVYDFVIYFREEETGDMLYNQKFGKKAGVNIEREFMYIPRKYRREIKELLKG